MGCPWRSFKSALNCAMRITGVPQCLKIHSPKSKAPRALTELLLKSLDMLMSGEEEEKGKAPRVKGLWSRNLWQTQDRWHTGSLAKFSTGVNSSQHFYLMPCLCNPYLHKQELQKNTQEKDCKEVHCLPLQCNYNTARPTWKHLDLEQRDN